MPDKSRPQENLEKRVEDLEAAVVELVKIVAFHSRQQVLRAVKNADMTNPAQKHLAEKAVQYMEHGMAAIDEALPDA